MGKKYKLRQYAEFKQFENCFEKEDKQKGNWSKFFNNDNPIVLELACGKGDYVIGLAKLYPNVNFIGVDIKGNRMWKGAQKALDENLPNVAFLRAFIDHLNEYFERDEVAKIWITFPDPQPKKERKRLTSPRFLDIYRSIMQKDGSINLKCDSTLFYEYTLEMIEEQNLQILENVPNVYSKESISKEMEIKTFYEKKWLKEGRVIKYLKFIP